MSKNPSTDSQDPDDDSGAPESNDKRPNGNDRQELPESAQMLAVVIVLVLATFLFYRDCFRVPFLFDDNEQIVTNQRALAQFFPSADVPNAIPKTRFVGRISFAMDYHVWGLNAFGYHATNLAVHLVAGLLLLGIVRRTLLLPRYRDQFGGVALLLAAAVALIWLLHPMQTGAVTYIVQRFESLVSLFYLATLYCVLRGSQSQSGWVWYGGAIAAIFLGSATKEVIVTAPFVVLMYDRVFLAESWRALLRNRGWVYCCLALAISWVFVANRDWFSTDMKGPAGFATSIEKGYDYPFQESAVLVHYLRLAAWPDQLCFDYRGWPWPKTLAGSWRPGLVVLTLLLASGAALWYRPAVGFLGMSFFFLLAPTSSFFPIVDAANEYRMYLPLAPLVTLLVLGCYTAANGFLEEPGSRRMLCLGVLIIVALGLGMRTADRNKDFADPLRLYTKTVAVNDSYRPNLILGEMLLTKAQSTFERGDRETAITLLNRALETLDKAVGLTDLPEQIGRAEFFLGDAYFLAERMGHAPPSTSGEKQGTEPAVQAESGTGMAEQHYRRAIALNPKNAFGYVFYGEYLLHKKQYAAAMEQFHFAHERDSRIEIETLEGLAQFGLGNSREAIALLRSAHVRSPQHPIIRLELARALATAREPELRDPATAVKLADERRRDTKDKDPVVLDVAAAAYASAERFDDAVATEHLAVELVRQRKLPMLGEFEARLALYEKREAYRFQPISQAPPSSGAEK